MILLIVIAVTSAALEPPTKVSVLNAAATSSVLIAVLPKRPRTPRVAVRIWWLVRGRFRLDHCRNESMVEKWCATIFCLAPRGFIVIYGSWVTSTRSQVGVIGSGSHVESDQPEDAEWQVCFCYSAKQNGAAAVWYVWGAILFCRAKSQFKGLKNRKKCEPILGSSKRGESNRVCSSVHSTKSINAA